MKQLIKKILKLVRMMFFRFFGFVPLLRAIDETRNTQTPVTLKIWFLQKCLGFNRKAYWPMHPSSTVSCVDQIQIGVETSPGLMSGCYIQGAGGIIVGDYTQIAPNVGLISANHDLHDNRIHVDKGPIIVGDYCWIGMGAVVLPGVVLGEYTIVGAGSVVTRSFPEGFCVIAGNPAKLIKRLEPSKCVKFKSHYEYIGYYPAKKMRLKLKEAAN